MSNRRPEERISYDGRRNSRAGEDLRISELQRQNRHTAAQRRRNKRRRSPHISIFLFLVILLYLIINLVSYTRSSAVAGYEVRTGSLSSNQIYTGIVLRQEEVIGSEYDGYVNYFHKSEDRIGVGQLAYTVDESGQIMDYLNSASSDDSFLSDSDYQQIQTDIVTFLDGFESSNFSSVYEFRDELKSTVQKMASSYILDDIDQLSSSGLSITSPALRTDSSR